MEFYRNDCLEQMKKMADNSVDSIITDPPYGLSFMGKKWDYDVPSEEIWKEALRVLKPGGTALIFAGSRTQHRMAVRVEDSGFILKDTIMWVYSTGFPKAVDISKQLDKKYSAEREVIGSRWVVFNDSVVYGIGNDKIDITAPSTDLAKQWDGWKSHGLKPSYEPILVCMKPNDGTYTDNAEKWGVAGLNIDGGRIGVDEITTHLVEPSVDMHHNYSGNNNHTIGETNTHTGRFPSNLIHDGSQEVLEEFPIAGNGSAARFFKQCDWAEEDVKQCVYIPKASRKEKDAGLDGLKKEYSDCYNILPGKIIPIVSNFHPTVKPISLMKYLCELTKTPTGGVVLDPFMGSGTTGIAAKLTGRQFIGIEMDKDYFNIAVECIFNTEVE